jgi:hypothetical protein
VIGSPPLLGFNNNVRHNGRVFHIQTEDSGTKYCRVVTHLFADGGRILRTIRTDYSQQLGTAEFTEAIRRLMKDQHRSMFAALRAGEFDDSIRDAFEVTQTLPQTVSESPASQKPELHADDLPALSLTPLESRATETSLPASRLIERPSNRSGRHSSPPPAKTETHRDGEVPLNPDPTPPEVAVPIGTRRNWGRPPMESNDSGHFASSRSLFGDSISSEQSLGDVILSYVEESKEKGSGRA